MAALKIHITAEDHARGPASAALTLVEYGDYECPYCGQAYPIVQEVQKQFGKRLRFVFRNFPLSEMHPHAEAAAEVAECAGAQGKFWEMHDKLFRKSGPLGRSTLFRSRRKAQAIEHCIASGVRAGNVRSPCPCRLQGRCPKWSERNADVLHQRASSRWFLLLLNAGFSN